MVGGRLLLEAPYIELNDRVSGYILSSFEEVL